MASERRRLAERQTSTPQAARQGGKFTRRKWTAGAVLQQDIGVGDRKIAE